MVMAGVPDKLIHLANKLVPTTLLGAPRMTAGGKARCRAEALSGDWLGLAFRMVHLGKAPVIAMADSALEAGRSGGACVK
jgi:hypothetical protein